jgi:hypothetical protein
LLFTAYKIKWGTGPKNLQDILQWNEPESRLYYEMKIIIEGPFTYTLPMYHIPMIWNLFATSNLDRNIMQDQDCIFAPEAFSKEIRIILLQKYYDNCDKPNCYICKTLLEIIKAKIYTPHPHQ